MIFAALAAGFLFGTPLLAATSAITQSDKRMVSIVERKQLPFAFASYLGKTNSVLSRSFTEDDFTFTGSKTWVDDGDGNFRLKFLSSGTFTPIKKVKIDIFLVGGGGGGRNGIANSNAGGGGAGGYAGTWRNIAFAANQSYTITIGAGGAANGGTGGTTSISGYGIPTMLKTGGTPNASFYKGGSGGSGGGGAVGAGGSDGSNGGSNNYGTGQGTTTREFGEAGETLYAGGGGSGGSISNGTAGGDGGGGAGGSAPSYSGTAYGGTAGTNNLGGGGGGGGSTTKSGGAGAAGGSGIAVIRNAR